MGTGAGLVVAAGVSAGAGLYMGNKQRKAEEDAIAEQERLQEEARENERKLLAEQARQGKEEGGATVEFGTGFGELGSYGDFLTPTAGVGGATAANGGKSGLGFA